MTNPTLERAARAAAEEAGRHDLTYSYGHDNGAYEAIARAVLMAVREPDEAMIEACRSQSLSPIWNEFIATNHTAMIDAILNEDQVDG